MLNMQCTILSPKLITLLRTGALFGACSAHAQCAMYHIFTLGNAIAHDCHVSNLVTNLLLCIRDDIDQLCCMRAEFWGHQMVEESLIDPDLMAPHVQSIA